MLQCTFQNFVVCQTTLQGFQEFSRQKRLYHDVRMQFQKWRERKTKEILSFLLCIYLLVKFCNIFDEAFVFFIDVSIV